MRYFSPNPLYLRAFLTKMTAMDVTSRSPFARRFLAWMAERFPAANAVLIVVLYLTAALYGASLVGGGELELSFGDLLGFAAGYAFFFMLRVFDEHKDYELDCQNHPNRVLQRGLISLGHLKVAGAIAIAVQLAVSIGWDRGLGPVSFWWALALVWSLLMAREFFAREWLQRRFLLYAFSHMLVMPLMLVWMAQMGAGEAALPREVGLLAILAFLSGASYELARKVRAPGDERSGVDTYTKILGVKGAAAAILMVLAGSTTVALLLLRGAGGGELAPAAIAAIAVGFVLPAATLYGFARTPTGKLAKRSELTVSVTMLVQYITVIATLIAERGVAWR